MKGKFPYHLILLLFIMAFLPKENIMAQCTVTDTVDMRGFPDSVYVMTVVRNSLCCGATGNDRCVNFVVYIDSMAQGINVMMSGGLGNTEYNVNCGPDIPVGTINCLTGTGPFSVTVCKPGGNAQTYTITSIHKPHLFKNPVSTYEDCPQTLIGKGLSESTVKWNAVDDPAYNNFLSCTTGCTTPTFHPSGSNLPSYIDYEITGFNISTNCDTALYRDTIRVIILDRPQVQISTANPFICPNETTALLNATGSGGVPPYSFSWSNSGNSSSVRAGPGVQVVTLTDSLGCYLPQDSIHVIAAPPITVNAGTDSLVCYSLDSIYLNASLQNADGGVWSGGNGSFYPNDSTINAYYTPTIAEKNLGSVSLVLTTYGPQSCASESDTVTYTFIPSPSPIISGSSQLCHGDSGNYHVGHQSGDSYNWNVSGGNITSGQGTAGVNIFWGTTGLNSVSITQTNSIGCSTINTFQVDVKPRPSTGTINYD